MRSMRIRSASMRCCAACSAGEIGDVSAEGGTEAPLLGGEATRPGGVDGAGDRSQPAAGEEPTVADPAGDRVRESDAASANAAKGGGEKRW